jgi:hypothetical protein
MFFLRFISVGLIVLGSSNIYGIYQACGAPTSAFDVLRSALLMSVVALAVGFGLFNPLPLMRTLSLGFFYFLALCAVYYQISWFLIDAAAVSGPSFLMGVLHSYQVELQQLLLMKNIALAVMGAGWTLILLPPLILNTADVKLFYGEDQWFSRPFVVRDWDLKPWFAALVFALLANLDSLLLPLFQKKPGECGAGAVRTVVATASGVAKHTVQHRDPQQKRWDEDKERASYAAFAQNNASFWVILNSGKLVHYSLTKYKAQVFEFGAYVPGSEDFLSLDGKYFYSPVFRQIFSTATSVALSIPVFSSERDFLGFAKNSTYLVYVKKRHQLQLLDAETGKTVFEIRMGLAVKHEDVKWSSERGLILFRVSDVAFQLLNLVTGKNQVQNLAIRQPENVFEDGKAGGVIINGPVGFEEEYKTYKVDPISLSVQEVNTAKRLLSLDPTGDAYLAGEKLAYHIVEKTSFQDDNPLKIDFRKVTVVPNFGSLAVIEDASPEVRLFDLKTGLRTKLAGPFSTGRSVDENNCVIASSRDGQLLYTSCWKQAEVFWVTSLNAARVQSWKINLPFEAGPAANPTPKPVGTSTPALTGATP